MMSDQSSVPVLRLKQAEAAAKRDCLHLEKGPWFECVWAPARRPEKARHIGTTIESVKTLRDGVVAVAGGIVEHIQSYHHEKG